MFHLAFGAMLVLQSPSLRELTVCRLNSTGLKMFTAQDGLATAEKSVLVAADSQLSTLQDPTSEMSAGSPAWAPLAATASPAENPPKMAAATASPMRPALIPI